MSFAKYVAVFSLVWTANSLQAQSDGDQKLTNDPTKVITKLSVGYGDFWTVRGSLAFGPASKVNASVSQDQQWSLGGSYLFGFGIVNFAASRKTFDTGVEQTQYSIGTFAPLDVFGVDTGKWQLFPMAGLTYTEGSVNVSEVELGQTLTLETSSKGGYAGVFALRPITKEWTFLAVAGASKGSDDYSGVSAGAGVTYNFTEFDSISLFATYTDNSFGSRDLLRVGYTREF